MTDGFKTYDIRVMSLPGGKYNVQRDTADQGNYVQIYLENKEGLSLNLPDEVPGPEDIKTGITRSLSEFRKERQTGQAPVKPEDILPTAKIKIFGQALFKALIFGEEAGELKASIRSWGANGNTTQLRIDVTDAPELAGYPWEALYLESRNQKIQFGIEPKTSISRILSVAGHLASFPDTIEKYKVLIVISEPKTLGEVGDRAEIKSITEHLTLKALKQGTTEGFHTEIISGATLLNIQQAIQDFEPHIVHYIGHSGFKDGTGYICLHNTNKPDEHVNIPDEDFAKVFSDPTPFLVILNSCEGSQSDVSNSYNGLAQSLVQVGVPYVVGMQFVISPGAANTFSDGFYRSLSKGRNVAQSVTSGRAGIYAMGPPNNIEFITPVLYSVKTPPTIKLAPQAAIIPDETTTAETAAHEKENERDSIIAAASAGAAAAAAVVAAQPAPSPLGEPEKPTTGLGRVVDFMGQPGVTNSIALVSLLKWLVPPIMLMMVGLFGFKSFLQKQESKEPIYAELQMLEKEELGVEEKLRVAEEVRQAEELRAAELMCELAGVCGDIAAIESSRVREIQGGKSTRSVMSIGTENATYETIQETVIVQEPSIELVNIPATYNPDGTILTPARIEERVIPAITKEVTRRVLRTPASTTERTTEATSGETYSANSYYSGGSTTSYTGSSYSGLAGATPQSAFTCPSGTRWMADGTCMQSSTGYVPSAYSPSSYLPIRK